MGKRASGALGLVDGRTGKARVSEGRAAPTTSTVLGAGGWGTALAIVLAEHGQTRLWCRRAEQAEIMARDRENATYLPGCPLPPCVTVTASLETALDGAEIVVVAVPAQHMRATLQQAREQVADDAVRVGAAKGIERGTLLLVSEILDDIWRPGPYAVLSGPSFAVEVARGVPTAVTVASKERSTLERVSQALTTDRFHLEASDDVIGVEIAGALKNVMAIAFGLVRGLGHGANTLAALLTRGLDEMRRLGEARGARPESFLSLAGVGDLVLTGTGTMSRNIRAGEALAIGTRPEDRLGSRVVVEGVGTAAAALALGEKHGVLMPITRTVVEVLRGDREAREAVSGLLAESLRMEWFPKDTEVS